MTTPGRRWFRRLLRLRPALAHRQRRRHLPQPLHLAPTTAATPPSAPSTPAELRRNRRRALLCWSFRHGVQLLLVPVYAYPVLATPTCAFIYDVFPGLASLVQRFVDIVFVFLRMPGAGNTGVCLRLRRVPGLGKPARRFVNTVSFRASPPSSS